MTPVENDGRIAQGAKGHGYRLIPHHIVDDFVPDQYLQRIGARVVLVLDDDYRLMGMEPWIGVLRRHEFGLVDGGNAVFRWAAGNDLFQFYGASGEVRVGPFLGEVGGKQALPSATLDDPVTHACE